MLGWHFLVFYEIEVSAHLLQLVLAQQIVHEYPRLGVEQRVVRSFLPTHDTVLHSEKVWPGEPDRIAQDFGERLLPIALNLVAEKIGLVPRIQFGITAQFCRLRG